MNENLATQLVLVCRHVLDGEREVELVVHHSDGKWQFMCGSSDHKSEEDVDLVHVEHLFEDQPELEKVSIGLQSGFLAERRDGNWCVTAHDD